MERKQQRKAEAIHLFYEMEKLRIKTKQKLKLAVEPREKEIQKSHLNKISKALKVLEKHI